MKIIYSENLFPTILKTLNPYYIIIGNVEYLIQESEEIIFNLAKKKGFSKKSITKFEYNSNFDKILFFLQSQNFLFQKKILYISLKKNKLTKLIKIYLSKLEKYFTSNLLLIIHINLLDRHTLNIQNEKLFKIDGTIIICTPIKNNVLHTWINKKIESLQINLTKNAKQLLIEYFQGNILDLNNALKIASLLWNNKLINTSLLRKLISDTTIFTPIQWINALLNNNLKLSIKILNRFYDRKLNPIVLIRYLQHDLLTILFIQRENPKNYLFTLKNRKIKENRYSLLINFAKHKNYKIIYKSIKLLASIEIQIKKNNNMQLIWFRLQTLSTIMCL